ncbi:MAG: glycosyltransferase family 87 protein [bacterium]
MNIWEKWLTPRNTFYLLIIVTLLISLQQYLLPETLFWDKLRPQYNNYLIFKYSFLHLLDGQDLYRLYPEQHGDYFKYSPTFALVMALFYYLPDWLGLTLWNLLNALALFAGITLLPSINDKKKSLLILFVLLELIGNLQNEQSNALVAGLILLSFGFLERKKIGLAALFIAFGFYLKIFGVLSILLVFFYPGKWKGLLIFSLWMLLLGMAPLLVISPGQLIEQYNGWYDILLVDHGTRYGFSVMGIIHKWIGADPSKSWVLAMGFLILISGMLKFSYYPNVTYRLLFLSSLLMWMILFNHTAESSGYILAMTGAGIWYFSRKPSVTRNVLMIAAFVIVSLFSTDIMPANIRNQYIYPLYIRTLPVLIIWVIAMFDLLRFNQPAEGAGG